MFHINDRPFGPLNEYILSDDNSGAYVTLIPEHGGALNRLQLPKGGKLYELLIGAQDYKQFISRSKPWYAGFKLFPFPNRVIGGNYSINDRNYKLPINEDKLSNHLHGLVYDKSFKIVRKKVSDSSALISLLYQHNLDQIMYPFSYELIVDYLLDSNGLSIKTTIKNTGNIEMPYGEGWHPYISTGTQIDFLELKIPSTKYLLIDDKMIPTGKYGSMTDFADRKLIRDKVLDTCFTIENGDNRSETIIYDPVKDLEVVISQESNNNAYNYLQLYTPQDRMSIAVEPMTCAPDAINNKLGLNYLKPGGIHSMSFGINLL